MATNFVNNYTGNNDFRGWLAKNMPDALAYTGNDGRVDTTALSKSLYGTGRVLGDTATAIRQTESQMNDDSNSGKLEYTPFIMKGLYDQWSAAQPNNDVNGAGTAITASGPSAWSSADQQNYQIGRDQVNSALSRLPNQLAIAQGNINSGYNNSIRDADQQVANNLTQFNQSKDQNQQNFRTSQNGVNQMAAGDRQSLLRSLAAMGAGGGSEAQYLIPELVGQQAAKGLAGAAQNFAQNGQQLGTAYNTFLNNDKQRRADLVNQRDQQLNQVESTNKTNKASLLDKLSSLDAQRTQAMGGDIHAALRPYLDQINTLNTQVDNLQRFTPKYSGTVADYVAPALSSFAPAQSGLSQAQVQGNAQGGVTPYLQLLLGQNKDRKGQPLAVFNGDQKRLQPTF